MNKLTMIAGAIALTSFTAPAFAGKHQVADVQVDAQVQIDANSHVEHKRHQSHHDQCEFNIDSEFAINNGALTFDQDTGPKITIDEFNNLFVDGSQVTLNTAQKALVADYADGIRNFMPEVANIAIDGVRIGVRASEIALSGLFGEDDVIVQDIAYRIEQLADKVIMRIDPHNFDSKTLETTFEKELEPEIEAVIKDAHAQLMPKLMAKGFTLFAAGDASKTNEFEQRMATLEKELETEVELMAEQLEQRAAGLCTNIEYLNNVEDQMVSQGLEMMDIIKKGHGQFIFSADKFDFDVSE